MLDYSLTSLILFLKGLFYIIIIISSSSSIVINWFKLYFQQGSVSVPTVTFESISARSHCHSLNWFNLIPYIHFFYIVVFYRLWYVWLYGSSKNLAIQAWWAVRRRCWAEGGCTLPRPITDTFKRPVWSQQEWEMKVLAQHTLTSSKHNSLTTLSGSNGCVKRYF